MEIEVKIMEQHHDVETMVERLQVGEIRDDANALHVDTVGANQPETQSVIVPRTGSDNRNDEGPSVCDDENRLGSRRPQPDCSSQHCTNNDARWPLQERIEVVSHCVERPERDSDRHGYELVLARFGPVLERFGPFLERYGPDLERYGSRLESMVRQLEVPAREVRTNSQESQWSQHISEPQSGSFGFGNEGFDYPRNWHQDRDGIPVGRQRQNSRHPPRRPFHLQEVRQWLRRRNMEGRELFPFFNNRRRNDNRNEEETRDRWFRGRRSIPENDNFRDPIMSRPLPNVLRQNDDEDPEVTLHFGLLRHDNSGRIVRQDRENQDDDGLPQQDDNPSAGPSRAPGRRPRSHMSLEPLNFSFPPLGHIEEFQTGPEDDNNELHIQQNLVRRREARRRFEALWRMAPAYASPLIIGQGDSKANDQAIALPYFPQGFFDNYNLQGGFRSSRIPRPVRQNRERRRLEMVFSV